MTTVLLGLLIVLNLTDVILTLRVLSKGGFEANPIARGFIRIFGAALGLIVMKVLSLGVVFALAPLLDQPWSSVVIGSLCAGYAWVVWHNAHVLRAINRERRQEKGSEQ